MYSLLFMCPFEIVIELAMLLRIGPLRGLPGEVRRLAGALEGRGTRTTRHSNDEALERRVAGFARQFDPKHVW